jgi:hypothetical protein
MLFLPVVGTAIMSILELEQYSIENIQSLPKYDKEKYKEMILDAAETVLGFFGFDRTVYSNIKKGRRRWLAMKN